jgi:hypothetical protein
MHTPIRLANKRRNGGLGMTEPSGAPGSPRLSGFVDVVRILRQVFNVKELKAMFSIRLPIIIAAVTVVTFLLILLFGSPDEPQTVLNVLESVVY